MSTKVLFISLIAAAVVGCSNDSFSPVSSLSPTGLLISPSDGQSGVQLDAGIVLTFPKPADRSVVERNLHLISELAMADSLCPVSTSMGYGDMDIALSAGGGCAFGAMDPIKMNHLVDRHRTSGRFQWDGDGTQCAFKPDSLMYPGLVT